MGENAYCKQQVSAQRDRKRNKTIAKNKAKNRLGSGRADTSIALHISVPTGTPGCKGTKQPWITENTLLQALLCKIEQELRFMKAIRQSLSRVSLLLVFLGPGV